MTPDPRRCGRLTIVEQVYYQPPGQQPISVESRFGRWVFNEYEPYHRYVKLTPEWEPIDMGHLSRAGMLIIANHEGTRLSMIPTGEEANRIAARVIEIGFIDYRLGEISPKRDMFQSGKQSELEIIPMWIVRPGEEMRAEPTMIDRIRLRSRSETADCAIYLFPF